MNAQEARLAGHVSTPALPAPVNASELARLFNRSQFWMTPDGDLLATRGGHQAFCDAMKQTTNGLLGLGWIRVVVNPPSREIIIEGVMRTCQRRTLNDLRFSQRMCVTDDYRVLMEAPE